ncbi:MAG TPA: response regulator [Gaiellaceae bacterium]|nr:response regulator [Gaiellaceae bacterium]
MSYREDGGRREPEWMTLGQAAKFLGVAQSTIRKWSDHGRIPTFYTPGRHRRYRRGDLETFLVRSGTGRQQSGPPVLLVDDDAGMRELVRLQLEREGYSVQEAASAAEGLAAIEARKPELILLDVMMPHVDGWEMLRQIQERYGVGSIPVLMFSGQVDEAGERQATSSGARGFVGKGFDLDELVDQAKAILPV